MYFESILQMAAVFLDLWTKPKSLQYSINESTSTFTAKNTVDTGSIVRNQY